MAYPPVLLTNFIGGTFEAAHSSRTLAVTNPFNGETITSVVLSSATDLDRAVQLAQTAFATWSTTNVKTRVQKLMKLHELMTTHLDELAAMVVIEHGKNIIEAKASITKGMETLEVRVEEKVDCSGLLDCLLRRRMWVGICLSRGACRVMMRDFRWG
jgi:acyl-CoA reductase-like NAD-dependent aldehyde dehydrogenase